MSEPATWPLVNITPYDTWLVCEECFTPTAALGYSDVIGRVLCDRCKKQQEDRHE